MENSFKDAEFFIMCENGDEIILAMRNGVPMMTVDGSEHGDSTVQLDEKSMRMIMAVLSQMLGEDIVF